MGEVKRLFLGIPIPEEERHAIQTFANYHRHLKGIRWIPKQNLHITTYFLGDVPVEQLGNLMELLTVGLKSCHAFELEFQAYCFAPRLQSPRMIWAKYKKHPDFRALTLRINNLYGQIRSVQQNRKSPIPHITIARLKNFEDFKGIDFNFHYPRKSLLFQEVVLWESILKPDGAKYEEMGRIAVRG